jgi:CrcB protein
VPLLLVIAVGGVLGSLARFGVAEALGPWEGSGLPWGTLTVNLLGCLAIGVIATSAWATSRAWLRPFLITGVLGGFTTFSALALETGVLLDGGQVPLAVGYVVLTMAAGLLAVRVGARANRRRA